MSNIAPELAVMIGLCVGVDYALFIVTRIRIEGHGAEEDAPDERLSGGEAPFPDPAPFRS